MWQFVLYSFCYNVKFQNSSACLINQYYLLLHGYEVNDIK